MLIIGNDHGALEIKKEILKYLDENKIEYMDFGVNENKACDYPDVAKVVVAKMREIPEAQGLLMCGTGIGISIAANRNSDIRCALCHDVFSAKATREHNDANVLAMGGRVVGPGLAIEILKAFLSTDFSKAERHIARIKKIDN